MVNDTIPTEEEILELLEVRDDLIRAIDVETGDPESIQSGLSRARVTARTLSNGDGSDVIGDHVEALADDISRAVSTNPLDCEDLREWIRVAKARVDHALSVAGADPIDPDPGTKPDPDRHRVIATVEADGPPKTIAKTEKTGYVRDGKIRRSAHVSIVEPALETWATKQAGAHRSGHGRSNTPPDGMGTTRWAYDTGLLIESSPAVYDGTVYFGCDDMRVYALDADTGETDWVYRTNGLIWSSPTIADGSVYVGSADGTVYALDAATGENRWRVEAAAGIKSSPAVAGGTVYIGGDDRILRALDCTSGERRWTHETDGEITSAVAVVENTVYATNDEPALYALDREAGTVRWTVAGATTGPVISGETLYIGTESGGIRALSRTDGDTLWIEDGLGNIESAPAADEETVYVGSGETLCALAAEQGQKRWKSSLSGTVQSSPVIAGDTIYVGGSNQVYAVDAVTGDIGGTYGVGDTIATPPAVADETVYAGCWDGQMYAIH